MNNALLALELMAHPAQDEARIVDDASYVQIDVLN